MEHELIQYESDFMEPGYCAVCKCGWKSTNAPTMTAANELYVAHVMGPQHEATHD